MSQNRFQDFFQTGDYLILKNSLYNYRLRKRAIARALAGEKPGLMLEIGSGISPVVADRTPIVYSDLSFTACQMLRKICPRGYCVVADATHLPFRAKTFSHAIASEVLEHLVDDQKALEELARVVESPGCLIVTFPHRKCYFANDDEYINHQRRYDLDEMKRILASHNLRPVAVQKILGPLEKVTMMAAVLLFHALQRVKGRNGQTSRPSRVIQVFATPFDYANRAYAAVVWLDARLAPQCLASCLLIKAEKRINESC